MSSQSLNTEDILKWDIAKCTKEAYKLFPDMLNTLKTEEQISVKTEILDFLTNKILPVISQEFFFKAVLSPLSVLLKNQFESSLLYLYENGNKTSLLEEVISHLNLTLHVIYCASICTKQVSGKRSDCDTNSTKIFFNSTIFIINRTYLHCKNSTDIYNLVLEHVSKELSTLFKETHNLQTSIVSVVDMTNFSKGSEDDVSTLCLIIEGFYEISCVAAFLDVKIMITLWKSISRLACQNYRLIGKCLKIDFIIGKMSQEITDECLKFFESSIFKGVKLSDKEEKLLSQGIKVFQFKTKVFVLMLKEYQNEIDEASMNIYYLLLHCLEKTFSTFAKDTQPSESYKTQILMQVKNCVEPIISACVSNMSFAAMTLKADPDLSSNLHLPRCMLLVNIMEVLISTKDPNVRNLWCSFSSLSVTKDRKPILSAFLEAYNNLGCFHLFIPPILSSPMLDGNSQRLTSTYEHILSNVSAFAATFDGEEFKNIEFMLLNNVLSPNYFSAIFSIDLWCFLSRYGTADLCFQQIQALITLFVSSSHFPTIEYFHLSILIKRLTRFLSNENHEELLNIFQLETNFILTSILPIEIFSQQLITKIFLIVIPKSIYYLEKLTKSSQQNILCFNESSQSLRCLVNLFSRNSHFSIVSQSQKQKITHLIKDVWSFISQYDESVVTFSNIILSLSELSALFIEYFENEDIFNVLKNFLSNLNQNKTVFKFGLFKFFKRIRHYHFPLNEQSEIFSTIALLFSKLLQDKDSIIQLFAFNCFAEFAEETVHEVIITKTLSDNKQLHSTFVDYLQKLPSEITMNVENSNYLDTFLIDFNKSSSGISLYNYVSIEDNSLDLEPAPKKSKEDATFFQNKPMNLSETLNFIIDELSQTQSIDAFDSLQISLLNKLNDKINRIIK